MFDFFLIVFQNFTFMQDLEDLWDKLTLPEKETPKETSSIHEIDKGLFMFDRFWMFVKC